jgi:hypothetical protein
VQHAIWGDLKATSIQDFSSHSPKEHFVEPTANRGDVGEFAIAPGRGGQKPAEVIDFPFNDPPPGEFPHLDSRLVYSPQK